MSVEQDFNTNFLPKGIKLQLHRDIPRYNVEEKLEVLTAAMEEIRDTADPAAWKYEMEAETCSIYWLADKFDLAAKHYQQALKVITIENAPEKYFLMIGGLVNCYLRIEEHKKALHWAKQALRNIEGKLIGFSQKLAILRGYSEAIQRAHLTFEPEFISLIYQVGEELEVSIPSNLKPIEMLNFIRTNHSKWNRRLMEIQAGQSNEPETYKASLEEFITSCDLGWYKKVCARLISCSGQ